MEITINGEARAFEAGLSVEKILEILQVSKEIMAVALNGRLVKKPDYATTTPQNGDKIELLQFMGGG